MGLVVIEEFLAPPPVGHAVVYTIETRTHLQVPQGTMHYAGSATVRQTVLAAQPDGYVLELVTLTQQAGQPNALAELLLDIARANSPLRVATDQQGSFQRVVNKPVLRTQWQELLPGLRAKYAQVPGSAAMLAQVAQQYADDNDYLEQALADKGLCGVLLPGIYALRPLGSDARLGTKTLHQFFRAGALPLHISWTATASDTFAQTADVVGVGSLDAQRFDFSRFQQELNKLTPTPPARPAPLRVQWQAQYTSSRTGQGLLSGRQWLRVTVPGLYAHETEHTLRLGAALAPPQP